MRGAIECLFKETDYLLKPWMIICLICILYERPE